MFTESIVDTENWRDADLSVATRQRRYAESE
jgi:hypothetical protein